MKREVTRSLLIFVGCLAALWLVGLTTVEVQSHIYGRTWPYDTLLFGQAERYTDFTIFYPRLAVFGDPQAFFSGDDYPFTYPAPLLMCMMALWKVTSQALALYLGIVYAFTACVAIAAFRAFPGRRGWAATLSLAGAVYSLPLFFLIDRANVEGFVWIATSAGLYCFTRRHYKTAAVLLAIAASMKIFPGLLLLLFLAKRRYREFVLAGIVGIAATVASLWATGPTIIRAAQGILAGLNYQQQGNVLEFRPAEIGFDHSLFSLVKWILLFRAPDPDAFTNMAAGKLRIYIACAAIAFALLYFARLRRLPVLNQVLVFSILAVLIPYCSFEYTLVHLTVPFLLLLAFLLRDVASGRLSLARSQILALLLPFVLIFGPLSFAIAAGIGFGGQVKAFALTYLAGVCLIVRLPSSMFHELA